MHHLQAEPHPNTARTVPNETKEAYGRPRADRDALDAGHGQGSLKEQVDTRLKQSSEDAEDVSSDPKAEELKEEGFTVGRWADQHDLAARTQP